MTFKFNADTIFEAENLDDAFKLLAGHFLELAGERYITDDKEITPKPLEHIGNITLKIF